MNYGFTLNPGETITRVIHRDFISLLPSTGFALLLAVVALGFAYDYNRHPYDLTFSSGIVITIIILCLFLSVVVFFIGVFVFSHNVLIFTNEHLIQVEQNGLFDRSISQVAFSRVQDVTGTRTGVFATILNYGDVTIQSAGEEENFIFHYAPNPEGVAADVLQTHEDCMKAEAAQGLAAPAE